MNTEINYLYRDASNYKNHGSIIVSGHDPKAEKKFEQLLDGGEYFIARQVGFPDLFLWESEDYDFAFNPEDDHCFHEMGEILPTNADPTDKRTIQQVLEDFKIANKNGWETYDPNPNA